MNRKFHLGAAMIVLTLTTTVFAQVARKPAPVCVATDASLPADLAAWRGRATQATTALAIGNAVTVRLRPIAAIRYAVPPEKAGAAGTFGGSITFNVARAATYRISLSEGAWIDVVRGGKAVASTTHGHGPECSSIRKIVAFPLKPGRHMLQFSGSPKPAIAVLVTQVI